MRFFVSAQLVDGPGWYTAELEAPCFDTAHLMAIAGAARKFGGQPFQITSVTKVPEIEQSGPLAIASWRSAA